MLMALRFKSGSRVEETLSLSPAFDLTGRDPQCHDLLTFPRTGCQRECQPEDAILSTHTLLQLEMLKLTGAWARQVVSHQSGSCRSRAAAEEHNDQVVFQTFKTTESATDRTRSTGRGSASPADAC